MARRPEPDHLHVRLVHRPARLYYGHHLRLGSVSKQVRSICHNFSTFLRPQDTAVQELRSVQGIQQRGGHRVLDERRLQPRPFLCPVHGAGRDHFAVCTAITHHTTSQFLKLYPSQCRDLLRKGLRGGEEKHRANLKEKNRGKVEYLLLCISSFALKMASTDGG